MARNWSLQNAPDYAGRLWLGCAVSCQATAGKRYRIPLGSVDTCGVGSKTQISIASAATTPWPSSRRKSAANGKSFWEDVAELEQREAAAAQPR